MKILRPMPTRTIQAGDVFDCRNCACKFEIQAHDAREMLGGVLRCPECTTILAHAEEYIETTILPGT